MYLFISWTRNHLDTSTQVHHFDHHLYLSVIHKTFVFVIKDTPLYVPFSKLPELGDTLFIVLRKQQLIFLHWYHHITVFIYVWYSYAGHTAPGRWFMVSDPNSGMESKSEFATYLNFPSSHG